MRSQKFKVGDIILAPFQSSVHNKTEGVHPDAKSPLFKAVVIHAEHHNSIYIDWLEGPKKGRKGWVLDNNWGYKYCKLSTRNVSQLVEGYLLHRKKPTKEDLRDALEI